MKMFPSDSPVLGLLTIILLILLISVKLLGTSKDQSAPVIELQAAKKIVASISHEATQEVSEAVSPPTSAPGSEENRLHKIAGQLKEGENLVLSLKRLAVPEEARNTIISSLRGCLDLRKLMPKDRITVFLDGEDQLQGCTYEASPFEIYEVKRFEDSFTANRKPVELDFRLEKVSGRVTSSLFQAFQELGEKPSLVYAFADIFASRIDFNTETQQDDDFSVIVEKYYKDEKFIGYGKILYASYEQKEKSRLLRGYLFARKEGGKGYFDEEGKELGTSFIRSPVPIGRVTSRFSFHRKHPISGVVRPHLGVDLAAPVGTPIMAAADGKVVFAGIKGGFGKLVILQHGNGYRTHYGHLSRFAKNLKKGKYVEQKEIIGYVGSTGVSTGPHLDYRLQENGIFKNPFAMKFKPRSILEGDTLMAFQDTVRMLDGYLDEQTAKNNIIQAKKITVTDQTPSILL